MGEIKPIETYYNGYRFRSRLEARWAVFFDSVGIVYEYEPEGLKTNNGQYYLPDFYLPQFYCYFEVKRAPKQIHRGSLPYEEYKDEIQKIAYGSYSDAWAGIIAFGDPYDHYTWLFCQAYTDSGGGSYDGPVVFGYYPGTKKPMLFAWDDYRDRIFLDSFEGNHSIPVETDVGRLAIKYHNPHVTSEIIEAELKARQARFEHGETPQAKQTAPEINLDAQKAFREWQKQRRNK